MDTSVLIGNGLNLSLKHSISWGNLLKQIAEDYDVKYNGTIQMPLEFECVANQCLQKQLLPSDNIYIEIKQKIAERISITQLPDDAIHHNLLSLPVDAIMTTNYDNLLEYVFDPNYKYMGKRTNKYLFDPTSIQKGIPFYHIHGHADSPKSICLGYEHYMGVVENLRREINSEEKNKSGQMRIRQVLLNPPKTIPTWYERFYTDNIYIIGLGLSESEVDIWWLITHRASIYYSNYYDIRKVLKNKIIFFDVLKKENLEEKKKIHYMLENSNVTVKKYIIGEDCFDYEDAYKDIFRSIKMGYYTKVDIY